MGIVGEKDYPQLSTHTHMGLGPSIPLLAFAIDSAQIVSLRKLGKMEKPLLELIPVYRGTTEAPSLGVVPPDVCGLGLLSLGCPLKPPPDRENAPQKF